MKFNLGMRLPRFRRTKPADGIPAMKTRSYLLAIISTVIPLLFFFMISYGRLLGVVRENAETLAITLRDSRRERISASIGGAFQNVASAASYALDSGTLTGYASADTTKPLLELVRREPALIRVTLYNEFLEPVAAVNSEGELNESEINEAIRKRLQGLAFEYPSMILELDMGDSTSGLVLFAKIADGARISGYVTAVHDYRALDALLGSPGPTHISLFNGRYQRIAGTPDSVIGGKRWEVVIDPLTERILDGFTETVRMDNDVHSYGYIDFTTTELFIDVLVPIEVGETKVGSFVVAFIFFTLLSMVFSLFVAWAHVRSIVTYGEALLVRSRFTREMGFFAGLSDNLDQIKDNIDSVDELKLRLERLRTDVVKIMDQLPAADTDDES